MSGTKKTSLARIRTYAQDRDALQNTSATSVDIASDTAVVTPSQSTPIPTKPSQTPQTAVVFPPLQKSEHIETPLAEVEKSFTPPEMTAVPKHIPAFHELTKELEHDLNPTPPTVSTPTKIVSPKLTKTNPQVAVKRETVALSGGTVITDTKRTDFNFFSSISHGITEFFSSLGELFKPKKQTTTYTVATPERRKGVVQKATSKTGALFTADNETLKEAILRRQREEKAKKEISWSAQTEPGYPLLEEAVKPAISNVVVTFKKPVETNTPPQTNIPEEITRWGEEPERQRTQPPQPITIPTPPISETVPRPVVHVAPEPIMNAAPITPITPVSAPTIVAPAPVAPAITQPVAATVTRKPKFLKPKTLRAPIRFTELRSNIVALTLTGVVIGLIVITITVRGLYTSLTPQGPVTQSTIQSVALLPTVTQGAVVVPTAGANSITQIIAAATSIESTGISEIRLLDTNQQELTPQAILSLLETQTNPNFNQAITALRVLRITNEHKGLLFEVTDPTTVFGAMLLWEPNLYSDVGQVLGSSPAGQTESFIDRTIGQSDVRILMSNGNEVLTYGFIDRNLLLITTTTTEFSRVLETL